MAQNYEFWQILDRKYVLLFYASGHKT